MSQALTPFFLYTAIVIAVAGAVLLLTWLIGGRHRGGARDEIYESGIIPTGGSRIRFPVKFYLVALFFLIFDLEVAFIFIWAYQYKALGWWGFWHITVFIVLLLAALAYPWLKGALDFVHAPKQK